MDEDTDTPEEDSPYTVRFAGFVGVRPNAAGKTDLFAESGMQVNTGKLFFPEHVWDAWKILFEMLTVAAKSFSLLPWEEGILPLDSFTSWAEQSSDNLYKQFMESPQRTDAIGQMQLRADQVRIAAYLAKKLETSLRKNAQRKIRELIKEFSEGDTK